MAFTRTFKVVALGHRAPEKGGKRWVINHDHTAAGIRGYLVPGVVTEVTSKEFFSDLKSGDCLAADDATAKAASAALNVVIKYDEKAVAELVKSEADKAKKLVDDAQKAAAEAAKVAAEAAKNPGDAALETKAANALRAAEAAAIEAGIRPPKPQLNGADKVLLGGE